MAFASNEIIKLFRNTKAPYNISLPSSEIAISALSPANIDVVRNNIDKILQERERLQEAFKKINGLGKILGGNDANFILVQVLDSDGVPSNDAAMSLYKSLADEMGIVVRFRGNEVGCHGCLRITVGNCQENTILLEKIMFLLKKI